MGRLLCAPLTASVPHGSCAQSQKVLTPFALWALSPTENRCWPARGHGAGRGKPRP